MLSAADRAVGSPLSSLASNEAACISANPLSLLLLAAPSVPNATFTPVAFSFATGQAPEANFMFDRGQWMTCAPCNIKLSIS